MPFRIIRNDITKVKADAIVNTANPEVAIGGGVDAAIYEAAGMDELLQVRRKIGRLEVGEVGITPAFRLDAKYIIHISGPCWKDGLHQEEELLRQCYDRALELARKHRCKSIAFPLLSTGTYGFSKELGLKIALEAFHAFLSEQEMEIILVVFGESAVRVSGRIFDEVLEFVDDAYVEQKLRQEYRGDGRTNAVWGVRTERCMRPVASREEESAVLYSETCAPELPLPKTSAAAMNLEEYLEEESGTFGEYLQQLINKKGKKNSEVYAAANMTKQYFSKLLKGKVAPSKTKILSLAIALQLNMDETVDFLQMSGYAFSPFSMTDKIFEYFIRNRMYDIYQIDIVLFDYGLPTLVNE